MNKIFQNNPALHTALQKAITQTERQETKKVQVSNPLEPILPSTRPISITIKDRLAPAARTIIPKSVDLTIQIPLSFQEREFFAPKAKNPYWELLVRKDDALLAQEVRDRFFLQEK